MSIPRNLPRPERDAAFDGPTMVRDSNSGASALADVGGFSVRAFATSAASLAMPIQASRPVAATDFVLGTCLVDARGQIPQRDELRAWTVARRLDALIAIRLAGGTVAERVGLKCAHEDCGEGFEAEIDLASCRNAATVSEIDFQVAGETVRARLPTGADHALWQEQGVSLALAAASLLGRDAVDSEETIIALERALADCDPARELELDLRCPACAASNRYVIDLEAHLIRAFARDQSDWLRQVARLASVFHWAEAEILRMPAWRRDFYLARIRDAEAGEAWQ